MLFLDLAENACMDRIVYFFDNPSVIFSFLKAGMRVPQSDRDQQLKSLAKLGNHQLKSVHHRFDQTPFPAQDVSSSR